MVRSLKGMYHLCIALLSLVWFRFPGKHLIVIGVTGTDGKTTTTTLIYEILKAAGKRVSMISSVHAVIGGVSYDTGFHVTTPNSFFVQKYLRQAVQHGDRYMVMEVTSHGLAQHRVFGVPFAVGVITNVTHEHLDWHKTFDAYLKTKLSLLRRSSVAIINRDEEEVYRKTTSSLGPKKVITYGIKRGASVTPQLCPFSSNLPGEFNRYNCLAAFAAGLSLHIPRAVIRKAITSFSGISGRMEVIQKRPFTVIVDFAHTPNALDNALKTARAMTKHRLIHVFGSAGLRDRSKRPLMGAVSSQYADLIVLTEEDYRSERVETIMDQIASGIKGNIAVHRFPRRLDAIAFAIQSAKPGDLVIVTGKGHEQSLCRGRTEYPWSDQQALHTLLRKRKAT